MLLNVFSDLTLVQQCSEFLFLLAYLYHTDTKLHDRAAVSLQRKVPALLRYPYNYCENCYILLQQLNDLSQLFDATALACCRSHACFTLHHQNQA